MNLTEWYEKMDKTYAVIAIMFIVIVILLVMNYQKANRIYALSESFDPAESTCSAPINSEKPTLILYYVDWCGYCKLLKPEWDKLKAENTGGKFDMVDINCEYDNNKQTCGQVQGFPTVLLHKGTNKPKSFDVDKNGSMYERNVKGLKKFLTDNEVSL